MSLIDLNVEGEWCIMGYFNIVEDKKASLGASSLLVGSQRSKWREVAAKWALTDYGTLA